MQLSLCGKQTKQGKGNAFILLEALQEMIKNAPNLFRIKQHFAYKMVDPHLHKVTFDLLSHKFEVQRTVQFCRHISYNMTK